MIIDLVLILARNGSVMLSQVVSVILHYYQVLTMDMARYRIILGYLVCVTTLDYRGSIISLYTHIFGTRNAMI